MLSKALMSKLSELSDLNSLSMTELNDLMLTLKIPIMQKTECASDICPNCHSNEHIITDRFSGMVTCTNCGQVLESVLLDTAPEWKKYDTTNTSRCGMPTNIFLPQSSLGTSMSGTCNKQLKNLQNWLAMPYKERSLNNVLTIIKEKCNAAGLLNCIEDDAKILYKIASEYKHGKEDTHDAANIIIRGKNRTGLIAACIFQACKRCGYSKSHKDIAKLFNINSSCVTKGCKDFAKYVKYKNIDYNTNLSHPSQYLRQICERLNMTIETINYTIALTDKIEKLNIIPSHTPLSIAMACLLLSANINKLTHITRKEITKISHISEVTLVKTYNRLIKFKEYILNLKSINETPIDDTCMPEKHLQRLQCIRTINISTIIDFVDIDLPMYLSSDFPAYINQCVEQCRQDIIK